MAHVIIDRRLNNKGKSTVNRQKLIRRVKGQVKEAVRQVISDGNIKDILSDSGKKINVPVKDLNEHHFHHGSGGMTDGVHPGNKDFDTGDRMKRPPSGDGGDGGSEGSNDPEVGEDEFEFHLTKEEFLDIFFEDLELPDLLQKDIATVDEFELRRAGFSTDGTPARLNVGRSMKQSKARRFALRTPKKRKLRELEKELEALDKEIKLLQDNAKDCSLENSKRDKLTEEINTLKRKIKAIPFIDNVDIRYNRWEKDPVPISQAVMFCIMDVSGSMTQWDKEMSKRFYMLLYLFLMKEYDHVDIVYIRHHTTAKEVDEEEFFHSRETGGTIVSPALELMYETVQKRYPRNAWNIYGCQASDGDNWRDDNPAAQETLVSKILSMVQYYAYIELGQNTERVSDLWPVYEQVRLLHDNFDMTKIHDASDIYPVFRKLFEKKGLTK